MQSELSGQSQLFDSLKVYLNNKSRLQPIIGLGSITECVNVGSEKRETLYLCKVCVCRLTKADVRNHILGSHHRFNYIKAYHPHSVSKWQESPDLSKLAWPLMELAKKLEEKEGPGDVQLFEVPDAVYQKIATESENNAAALINTLKDEQGKPENFSETMSLHYPFESQRIVLRPRNLRGVSEVFDSSDMKPYEISTQTEFPPLIPANQTPGLVCLKNATTSELKDTQMLPEPSVPFESGNFFEDLSGGKPCIGLVRVDELKSNNGSSHGFLCHCCRIRSNKKDIFDHLTSYSHMSNYLMETQPDLVDILKEDTEANVQLLQSLADQVEQQEGRGELKIVKVPESFCKQITGKSYHWCLRMLSNGWVNTKIQKKKEAVQGMTKHLMSTKIPVLTSNRAKKEKPQKKRKKRKSNTMFNVSFPLRKGALLVERTSFNKDNVLELTSPLSDSDPVSSPADRELKCDAASFENNDVEGSSDLQTSQLERELYEGDVGSGEYAPQKNIRVTVFQDAEGGDGVHFTQSDKETESEDQMIYRGSMYRRQDGSRRLFKDWQIEDVQAQRRGPFPVLSNEEDWSYKAYSRQEEDNSHRWYSSPSSQMRVDEPRPMNENNTTCAAQHYLHQDQQMMWGDAGSGSGSIWGHHNLPGEVASFVEAARTTVPMYSVHGGSFSSVPGVRFPETDPRQTGTGHCFYWQNTVPQNYPMQHAAIQVNPIDQVLNSRLTGFNTNPNWYGADPVSSGPLMQPEPVACIQPEPALCYGAGSDVYFRTGVPTDGRHFPPYF